MALNSSRLLIAQGLVALLQGVQNTNTSANLYLAVKLGSFFDPSPYSSGLCADVTFFSGKSGPAGSGGNLVGWRIEDNPVFAITTLADYEADSTAAMTNTLTAMDMLMPILHSHYQIPNRTARRRPLRAFIACWRIRWTEGVRCAIQTAKFTTCGPRLRCANNSITLALSIREECFYARRDTCNRSSQPTQRWPDPRYPWFARTRHVCYQLARAHDHASGDRCRGMGYGHDRGVCANRTNHRAHRAG